MLILGIILAVIGGVVILVGSPSSNEPGPRPVRVRTEVPVTALNLTAPVANNSPELAADPTDQRFIVLANRLDNPFSCSLSVSGDGGRSWLPANPIPKLPVGADTCYAPEIAFDGQGTLYYLFVGLHGRANSPMGVFLTTSIDRARGFSMPRQVLGAERYMVRMAIDPAVGSHGRIHLAWLRASSTPPSGGLGPPPNPIMTAYSDDGGAHLSPPVQVSDPARRLVVAPALTLGPDHSVHVLYYDLGTDTRDYDGLEGPAWDGTWSLVETASADGGQHFSRGVEVDSHIVPPERVMLIYTMAPPAFAGDEAGGLFAAWSDARDGDSEILLRRSDDGGRSWKAPQRLNDDPGQGRSHLLPRLSTAPGGRLDAIFYDRRNDPHNELNDVYYTFSLNGGSSFTRNTRLTPYPSDSRLGPTYPFLLSAKGRIEFGSRLALLSDESKAVVAWTDTHHSTGGTEQDIFATQVDLPASAQHSPWKWVLGGTMAAVGVLICAKVRRSSFGWSDDGGRSWKAPQRLNDDPRWGRRPHLATAPPAREHRKR